MKANAFFSTYCSRWKESCCGSSPAATIFTQLKVFTLPVSPVHRASAFQFHESQPLQKGYLTCRLCCLQCSCKVICYHQYPLLYVLTFLLSLEV